ncbi:MAG: LuxR C-terminal-related transcriptional regulator [Acidimicrobiia bacterium]
MDNHQEVSMIAEPPNLLSPWSNAWDDEPVAALEAIEASLRRGDTDCALMLIRSIRRRLPASDQRVTSDRFGLTDREMAALVLLPDATLSQKDIARALGITGNTLKTHLRSIYLKLGVHSRAEAIEVGGLGGAVAAA